jgi:hypothetical protein
MDKEFMPGIEQFACHGLAHVAEAKAADAHHVTPLKVSGMPEAGMISGPGIAINNRT